MEVQNKKILVIGLGRSGLAAAKVLHHRGAMVTACDVKTEEQLGAVVSELKQSGITVWAGGYPPVSPASTDLIVISPGVPLTIPPVQQALADNIPILSELELAYRFSPASFVAITGTNGKTTTTALIGQILQEAGFPVLVGGNIGLPLIEEVTKLTPAHVVVAEVSSFQLERSEEFRPKVAVILNITPDHLDRHGTMDEYTRAKAKIFARQQPGDFTVLNYDDKIVRGLADQVPGQVIFFSRKQELNEGVFVRSGQVVVRMDEIETVICPTLEIGIKGAHNLENALAAVGATWVLGVTPESLAHSLRKFPGVPHRLEFVAEINGVKYINDSKGTNPDAAMKALDVYSEPIVLIAGGKNKGSDFTEFAQMIRHKVKDLVLVGQASGAIRQAVEKTGFTNIHQATTFPEAVIMASKLAEPGDVVLLSPACASWDMFNNFEERGDLFKQVVRSLRG
ncbi:MAG: UDP-N-acetylmuramoyl-L-alanine--D-glutamate ligase [Firmicutes bacterium]|nr:UDP-N-acetylmuramoyl-L-alanine--D-glutamate ligase [Bacillota bacterium]